MKRLVFCFDGSWNRLDAPHPTNVLLTAESVVPMAGKGVAQVTFYDEGVGSAEGEAFAGGVFGAGLVRNLSDGYRFLIFNYAPGDEIYVFGFSRGAYTARSFVGLLNACGILERQHARLADEAVKLYKRRSSSLEYRDEIMQFRRDHCAQVAISDDEDAWRVANVPGYVARTAWRLGVRYLGVWDTVGALGIPHYIVMADAINRMHQFHDVSLSPLVEQARHAVAIDEHKVDFQPTLWENLAALNAARGADPHAASAPYQQRWFAGGHGSVGGGGERRGLSDLALEWIWDGARQAGLQLDTSPGSHLARLAPSHREHLVNRPRTPGFNPVSFVLDRLPTADRSPGPLAMHELSPLVARRWQEAPDRLPEAEAYRPPTLAALAPELDAGSNDADEATERFTIYIVRPGDTLRSIARRIYGSVRPANAIFRANRNKLATPNDLHPGQSLRLPKLD